ncbi:hypothetical protein AWM75_05755 [Aerococcus urinaehominis]|uniref:Flavodoxin-like fold domain-containing protein n=1 Tax=Aerococcus urinaehominis TaxID=128944 RepID=A0A109RH03_9LACT|nr:NAD(P)H-dependent oxidoreductase [Aerococcus urinaehominis]AMB99531.1 hypothetical protein AWM75_05755 [Aerococcus urinaehominis]SDM34127.1 Putative NADPH-quinone reductase (modulator of drug activity B) [Aerococcus urinaehominis]
MEVHIFEGHPNLAESASHQFLKAGRPADSHYHQLANFNSSDILLHRDLILAADRIVLQFPLYWYQAPALVVDWLNQVLADNFVKRHASQLAGKDFGLVISTGQPLSSYQSGGREAYTVSEMLRPYQMLANRLDFNYLPVFVLAQHSYQSPESQQLNLVAYQSHLSLPRQADFIQRSNWLLDQLPTDLLGEVGDLFMAVCRDRLNELESMQFMIKEGDFNDR